MDNPRALWFTLVKSSKIRTNSIQIYKELYPEIAKKIDSNLPVNQIINWIRQETINTCNNIHKINPKVGALNNSAGRWNEYIATSLLSEIALDLNITRSEHIAIFSLPNSMVEKFDSEKVSSKFLNLFDLNEFLSGFSLERISKYRRRIFLSSPDYVVVTSTDLLSQSMIKTLLENQARDPGSFGLYNFFENKLLAKDLKAAISLKTSNRPDRRYQPLFEAAMIKAMGAASNQNWKYFMVSSQLSPADLRLFGAIVPPHSLLLDIDLKLVDATYLYSYKSDLIPLMRDSLS